MRTRFRSERLLAQVFKITMKTDAAELLVTKSVSLLDGISVLLNCEARRLSFRVRSPVECLPEATPETGRETSVKKQPLFGCVHEFGPFLVNYLIFMTFL